MIPILAKNAVKIKCGFSNAIMTGNYECAYGLGVISALAGLPREENIENIRELYGKVLEAVKSYEPESDEIKRLIDILREYEPADLCDVWVKELYYMGFNDKMA